MGLFDEVWFEKDLPDFPSQCRRFQTKSLHCDMERYTVTKAGRLHLTRSGCFWNTEAVAPEGGVDVYFHGDLRLVSETGPIEEYVARFTHGTLEWIRPLADIPEFTRST